MSRTPFVCANWKMNGDTLSNRIWVEQAKSLMSRHAYQCDIAVCAPTPYLSGLVTQFTHSRLMLGAQNVAHFENGAYTGEVSADMLADIGCDMVIVGHSERRTLLGETDEQIAKKAALAFSRGIMPILCVGETLQEREEGRTLDVVKAQLTAVLSVTGLAPFVAGAIAYEPIWAIGTGKSASPADAQNVHRAMRECLAQMDPQAAQNIRLLYGGSVKPGNAVDLFAQDDIDGALVGGASLHAQDFFNICDCADALVK